jgi:hypothetical protein
MAHARRHARRRPLRDLDTVEDWLGEAEQGRFEVLSQNGYIVGAPTYLPVAELAIGRPIAGALPRPSFPDALATAAARRWEGRAGVALMFAQLHGRAGDAVCCTGMLANAILCVAHARLAERREWVLNEKRLVQRAGLEDVEALLARPGASGSELAATVAAVSTTIGAEPLAIR